jgi:hypothetical protein
MFASARLVMVAVLVAVYLPLSAFAQVDNVMYLGEPNSYFDNCLRGTPGEPFALAIFVLESGAAGRHGNGHHGLGCRR